MSGTPSGVAERLGELVRDVAGEHDAVRRAVEAIGPAVLAGGRVLTFGAGHAQAFAMELHSRAGGMPCFMSMSLEDIVPLRRPFHLSLSDSEPERRPKNGRAVLDLYELSGRDALVIASNSGRNGAIVEMAIAARGSRVPVVAVTSLAHTASVTSRHPSGLKLVDVADVVIDNHCPAGESLISAPVGPRICAGSTVAFAAIAQMINEQLAVYLTQHGRAVTSIASANVD